MRHVLGDCYLDPQVLGMKTYVQQATAINYKLTQEGVGCGFAYLDLEKLTGSILAQDLTDKTSLAARMLTEKPLREALMRILDGATGSNLRVAGMPVGVCSERAKYSVISSAISPECRGDIPE